MLYHLVIIAAYAMTSVVVGRQLPAFVPELDVISGYWIGGTFFLICALAHEFVMRRVERHELKREIKIIRRDLSAAEGGLERFETILGGLTGDGDNVDGFASEMKMLRKLLNQLSTEMKKEAKLVGDTSPKSEIITNGSGALKAKVRPPLVAAPPQLLEEEEEEEERRKAILEIVRSGLQENRVDLYLQPIVRLPQRKAKFYEAFSRIRGKDGEIITPRQYLAIAEEAGLIGTIDNLLLIRCVQLIRRVRQKSSDVGFFVNISARTMRDNSFFHQFVDFLDRNSDLTENLILEFAQKDIDSATKQVKDGLTMLTEMGFIFSMDQVVRLDMDFQKLAADNFRYLKVSASDLLPGGHGLPMNIHPEDLQEALARAEIELIASQVEDEDTVIGLLDADVSFGQGYLFGVPRPPHAAN